MPERTPEVANEPVAVVWLVDHLAHNGIMHGASRYYLSVIPRLDPASYRVTLCVLRAADDIAHRFQDAGVEVISLGRGKFDFRAVTDVVRIVNARDARIIHCHGYGAANMGRLAALFCSAKALVHYHDDGFSYPWYQRLADAALRPTAPKAIAVSENVAQAIVEKMGYDRGSLYVLPNGIDLDRFSPDSYPQHEAKAMLGLQPNDLTIGTVARLRQEKGVDTLIEAFAIAKKQLVDGHLIIAGDGPDRAQLEQLVMRLGIAQSVHFLGEREDVPTVLAAMDVFVLASRTEGFGLALVEAMAMGKPVVASNLAAVRALIENRVSGLIVSSRAPEEFAKGIIEIAASPDFTKRLTECAKRQSQALGLMTHLANLQRLYDNIIRR